MGRLPCGSDLLGELIDICVKEQIALGRIEAIGSLRRARLAFYHQDAREYRHYTVNRALEIASFTGNISLKEGAPFVHAHLIVAGTRGRAWGGHLASGTEVFACEFIIEVFSGPVFSRGFDVETGLHLWELRREK